MPRRWPILAVCTLIAAVAWLLFAESPNSPAAQPSGDTPSPSAPVDRTAPTAAVQARQPPDSGAVTAPADEHRGDGAFQQPTPAAAPASAAPITPRLIGSIVVPAGFTASDFAVRYRRPGQAHEVPIGLRARDEFRLFAAEPGDITVTVRALGDPLPLREVAVRLPEAGTNADPRLQRMTFPELRVVQFALLDQDGTPALPQASALALWSQSERGLRYWSAPGQPLRVKLRHRPHRVVLCPRGFMQTDLEVDDQARVTLQPSARIAVKVTADAEVFAGSTLAISIEPQDAEWSGSGAPPPAGFPMSQGSEGKRIDFVMSGPQFLSAPPSEPLIFEVTRACTCRVQWIARKRSMLATAEQARGTSDPITATPANTQAVSVHVTASALARGQAQPSGPQGSDKR